MRRLVQSRKTGQWLALLLAGGLILCGRVALPAHAAGSDYNSDVFGGSPYVMHGPAPAYGGAYSYYGGNATGIEGRFSASYGEYGAMPGYGRFGVGSGYGMGPLRGAGTGRGWRGPFESRPYRQQNRRQQPLTTSGGAQHFLGDWD